MRFLARVPGETEFAINRCECSGLRPFHPGTGGVILSGIPEEIRTWLALPQHESRETASCASAVSPLRCRGVGAAGPACDLLTRRPMTDTSDQDAIEYISAIVHISPDKLSLSTRQRLECCCLRRCCDQFTLFIELVRRDVRARENCGATSASWDAADISVLHTHGILSVYRRVHERQASRVPKAPQRGRDDRVETVVLSNGRAAL